MKHTDMPEALPGVDCEGSALDNVSASRVKTVYTLGSGGTLGQGGSLVVCLRGAYLGPGPSPFLLSFFWIP